MKRAKSNHRYLRIDDTVYQSAAFRTLPASALKLWFDMRTQFRGSNNGNISATMSILGQRGWTSPDTLYRALGELLARGLIERTRHGKPGPYRLCSLFRFTDLATAKNEAQFIEGKAATCEFLNWSESEQKKIRATETVATPLRKPYRYNYGNRSVDPATATEIVAQKNDEIGREAAPVLDSSATSTRDGQHYENRTPLYLPGGEGSEFDRARRKRQTYDAKLARQAAARVRRQTSTTR